MYRIFDGGKINFADFDLNLGILVAMKGFALKVL